MEYNIYRNPDSELYHWGVKGMKWGVRRYQRKDGSLTPAGKKRRAKLEAELEKLGGNGKKPEEGAVRKKSISEMSNKELQEYTTRMQLEKNYYDAQKQLAAMNPKQVPKGRQIAEDFINKAVIPATTAAGKAYIEKMMKEKMGIKEDVKVNWDDKTKEQTYLKNEANKILDDLKRDNDILEEKNRRENIKNGVFGNDAKTKAAKKSTAESDENATETNSKNTNSDNKKQDSDNSTGATGVKGDKWVKNSSEKVYEGTVEGSGKSKKQTDTKTNSKKETVIDAEWYEVSSDDIPKSATNRGRDYVAGFLNPPRERDD